MTFRALALALTALFVPACSQYTVEVPEYERPPETVRLDQGWSSADRVRFHHTAQGTRLLPYDWFMALEQPCFSPFGCDLLADEAYLPRFGFVPSERHPELNPDGLPVGFAREADFRDPGTGAVYSVVGITCAACHTGEIFYGNYAVQIEGAPGMIEIGEFQKAVGLAMGFTQKIPFRYGRFERRVLGPGATDEQKAALKSQFDAAIAAGLAEAKAAGERKIYESRAGFIRTDALNRIGNQVFAIDMRNDDNLSPANAAVRYPQIWDASWFDWVQYNSSIADPLVRNIGESLGVRATLKLYGPDAGKFENSVNVRGLKTLEDLLSGPAPYEGLRSPQWPSVFPAIDQTKAARGADLYKQHCEGCHRPPVDEIRADLASESPRYWRQNAQGKRFFAVKDVKLDYIGTDPLEATEFINRTADSGPLGRGRVSAGEGLELVTKGIAVRFFEEAGLSPEERIAWSGYRNPDAPVVRADAIYKARPLNGIWAAAPYLHNGSVPNLYELLSPREERSKTFWLGSKRYDPVHAGYETAKVKGGYLFDTSRPGDSNSGHEFTGGQLGGGVIGPLLPPEDRWALVEYLKTL